ncbi:hypothetical protein Tco_0214466 [Tanacetum coccineum]
MSEGGGDIDDNLKNHVEDAVQQTTKLNDSTSRNSGDLVTRTKLKLFYGKQAVENGKDTAQKNLEQQVKECDEKNSELDSKLNRLHKRAKQQIQEVQKVIEQPMARSDTDLKMAKLLASAAICQKWGCYRLVSELMVIENKVMSSYTHPSIPSDYDVKDAFSSINAPNYIPTSPGCSPVTPQNTSLDSSDDLTKYLLALLALSPFHDAIPPPQAIIALPAVLPPSPVLSLSPMFDSRDFFSLEKISPPKDTETPF